MWNPQDLNTLVVEYTHEYRKGPEITSRLNEQVRVVEIWAMPHVDEAQEETLIDVHFEVIGVDTKRALADDVPVRLTAMFENFPEQELLRGGPSYITLGGILGSQDIAMRLFALGEALEFWKVITPEVLGMDGEEADKLAGSGMVMCSGWRPQ